MKTALMMVKTHKKRLKKYYHNLISDFDIFIFWFLISHKISDSEISVDDDKNVKQTFA